MAFDAFAHDDPFDLFDAANDIILPSKPILPAQTAPSSSRSPSLELSEESASSTPHNTDFDGLSANDLIDGFLRRPGEVDGVINDVNVIEEVVGDVKADLVGLDDDVLQVMADLSWPLRRLRPQISARFGDYTNDLMFYLAGSSFLTDETSLAEQCTASEGRVCVQIRVEEGQITIEDVMTAKDDSLDLDLFSASASQQICHEASPSPPPAPAPTGEPACLPQLVVSPDFARSVRTPLQMPESVRDWTIEHTLGWLRWARRTFSGIRLPAKSWSGVDGFAICEMTKSEFEQKVKNDRQGIFYAHFDCLRSTNEAFVPETMAQPASSSTSKPKVSLVQCQRLPTPTVIETRRLEVQSAPLPPPAKKPKVVLGKYEQANVFLNVEEGSGVNRTGNNGLNIHLWRFLLEILTDSQHRGIIRWNLGPDHTEGEFVMSEPEAVAKLWGTRKSKPNMNYEKLSRAMRYYKGGDILDKVAKKKFTYRFVCDLRDICGYSAHQLARLVQEKAKKANTLN